MGATAAGHPEIPDGITVTGITDGKPPMQYRDPATVCGP